MSEGDLTSVSTPCSRTRRRSELETALLDALESNRLDVELTEEETDANWQRVLDAVGARTTADYQSGLRSVDCLRGGDEFRVTPLTRRKGGFVGMTKDEVWLVAPKPGELAQAIERAINSLA